MLWFQDIKGWMYSLLASGACTVLGFGVGVDFSVSLGASITYFGASAAIGCGFGLAGVGLVILVLWVVLLSELSLAGYAGLAGFSVKADFFSFFDVVTSAGWTAVGFIFNTL